MWRGWWLLLAALRREMNDTREQATSWHIFASAVSFFGAIDHRESRRPGHEFIGWAAARVTCSKRSVYIKTVRKLATRKRNRM